MVTMSRLEMKNRYDLVHVHNIPDTQVFSALLPKLRGAKIILDIHDIVPELFCSKFGKDTKSIYFRILQWKERISACFADHIIVANHLWGEKLVHRSVSQDRCTVILNYPGSSVFGRQPAHQNGQRDFIIYPGTLNHHQGLDIALKAFSQIRDLIPKVDFHIYGEGPALEGLQNLAAELKIQDRVEFRQPVSTECIAEIMATAKCGVVPKRADLFGNEAFSTKVLEFMALGVPVVLSNTAIDRYYFNPSLVSFFEPGSEENLAEKMLLVLTDEGLRSNYINNSLEFVQDYSWSRNQKIYLELVETLTKRPPDKLYPFRD
jgi:glycosyltransferase involved in cell wall biosynthesis